MNETKKQKQLSKSKLFKAVLIVILVIATIWITVYFSPDRVRQMIEEAGPNGQIIYILLWTFLPIGFFPVPVLAIAGGMGYGLWQGSLLTFIGASFNMIFMFFMSRYLFRLKEQTKTAIVFLIQ